MLLLLSPTVPVMVGNPRVSGAKGYGPLGIPKSSHNSIQVSCIDK